MISQIDASNFNKAKDVLVQYGREIRKDKSEEDTLNEYKKLISDPNYKLFFYEDNNSNQGISLVNIKRNQLQNIYFKDSNIDNQVERDFFAYVFNFTKKQGNRFMSQFEAFSNNLKEYMKDLGISTIIRHEMLVDRSKIIKLKPKSLSERYRFAVWDDSYIQKCAELEYSAFKDSIDFKLGGINSVSAIKKYYHDFVNNKIGILQRGIEFMLFEDDEIIGYCIMSDLHGYGFILTMAIVPDKSGQGLGTSLLIHAMQDLMAKTDKSKVGLTVTEENANAFHLYKKLGFEVSKSQASYMLVG